MKKRAKIVRPRCAAETDDTVERLQARIEELEAKVEELESELADHEEWADRFSIENEF